MKQFKGEAVDVCIEYFNAVEKFKILNILTWLEFNALFKRFARWLPDDA